MELYLASPQQIRVRALEKTGLGPPFRACCRLRLSGEIDPHRFRQALARVVMRHEILRTILHEIPGYPAPVQEVTPAAPVLDASLRLDSPVASWLSLSLPSVCADRAALRNVVRELLAEYQAGDRRGGEDSQPLQYADFAAWQSELLAAPERAAERQHWSRLGLESWLMTRLPHAAPFAPLASAAPFAAERTTPPGLAASLAALARTAGISLERILLAAWQLLLARLLRLDEILVAAPFAGRTYEDVAELPGLFARFLPVLVAVREEEPLAAALRRLDGAMSAAAAAQESFAWSSLGAGGRQPPELPFGFELQTLPDDLAGAGLTASWVELRAPIDRQAVLLACSCDGGALTTRLEIASGRLDAAGAERLLAQYHALLCGLAATPGAPVGDLELRCPEDVAELRRLNASHLDLANDRGLAERFAAQAARTPDRLAVGSERFALTYAELGRRVSRLAGQLRTFGVGPDTLVAVCVERSVEMVVALLAVLEAGGAWVPLDPDDPPARLALLLDESRPAVLLVSEALAGRFPATGIPIVRPGPGAAAAGPAPAPAPALAPAPAQLSLDQLAYVCFTSGTTGRPKGVMISHRAISNRLLWMERALGLSERDRVLLKTSLSFDASVWEILSPLLAGAHLVLARPGGQRDPAYLLDLMARHQVTVLQAVPSHLRSLLQAGGIERCDQLRWVFCGGEALPAELAADFHGRHAAELHNLYGPTETAIDALSWPCPRSEPAADPAPSTVPIGRPIANLQAYLLSSRLAPMPVGAVAELFLGGAGLARGYLERPDLTAERFLPNPFSRQPGARMYRTGDLGRAHPDGVVEFLGRVDHQIKVRGFRIEPGEVEAALRRHPGVQDAVVGPGGPLPATSLAAWVVPVAGRRPTARELRQWLTASLPEFMLPSTVALLEALPRTPGGKIDRRALFTAEPGAAAAEEPTSPRSFTEQALAAVWAEVLGIDRPGVHDHFFEQGGHSLLAVQLMSRLAQVFGVELRLRALFEAPTLGELAAVVDTALQGGRQRDARPLLAGRRAGSIPLSFAQQRLWFLDRLDPGSSAYNISQALSLRGMLDPAAFRSAAAALAARHESLRTTFPDVEGSPVQRISPRIAVRIPLVDLSAVPLRRRGPAALALAQEAAERCFDLAAEPPWRLLLMRRAADDHVVSLNMHHIVSDGWSTGVLLRDFTTLYDRLAHGSEARLPELPVQYADFAIWQRQWLQGEALAEQVAWWRRLLGSNPPPLQLPTDRPRPRVPSLRGRVRPLVFPPALVEALDRLGLRRGATLFMTLLAGFGALFHRTTGQCRVLVGSPIANRNRLELENLIGFFVNTLVLPVEVDRQAGFGALLASVRELCLGAAAHQDLPFEKLVEELQPARDTSRSPLMQVMLALQIGGAEAPVMSGVSVEPLALEARTAKFDLTLDLTRRGPHLRGALEHSVDLFDGATIDRFAAHFLSLLRAAAAEPERAVAELELLGEAERWQLTGEWNSAPEEPAAVGRLVHDQLAALSAARPDAIALIWQDLRISCGELARRSNRVAHALRQLGVGPDSRVCLCADRSPELIFGILGILNAGGAYVPLDPTYPRQRLADLLSDLPGAVLVGQGRWRDRLPDLGAHAWLDLEAALREDDEGEAAAPPPPAAVGPGNLVYVFFTSGSTGRPKGVEVTHGSLARLLAASRAAFAFDPGDVWTLFHSSGFDFSVWEMWGALLSGGSLALVPTLVSRSPAAFLDLLRREQVTILNQTPAAFQALLRAGGEAGGGGAILPAVRRVFLGGEALEPASLRAWFAAQGAGAADVVDLYGPTETTVCITWRRYAAADADVISGSLIGRVFPGSTGHVLDGGELVPAGVPGELYLGGSGVTRGYLGRPDLTAERYVPDPFGQAAGGRLYRSGDRVRRRADGELEFLGRLDRQVKIRSFRIELGEIEAALLRHPAIRQAHVAVRETAGDRRLTAWVVATAADLGATEPLRAFLRERLPEHMLPASLTRVDGMPLTPQGKIDTAALPAPSAERQEVDRAFLAPRNTMEEILAGVWAGLLGIERVGVEDDFFALGGHSLLAAQVLSRVERIFRVRVPLRALFGEPTVAGLARQVAAAEMRPGEADPIPLRPDPRTAPLSFAQQRLWFLHQWNRSDLAYTIGAAFRAAGALDPAVLRRCLGEVIRRHEMLRTTFVATAGAAVQVVGPAPLPRLPVVDLAGLPSAVRARELRAQAERCLAVPFDLSRDLLLRPVLLRLGADDQGLVLTTHHIAADGWSLGVLAGEVAALYGAFAHGEPSPLPDLSLQYGDFAAWQRQRLQGGLLAEHLSFWRGHLASAPAVLELPLDLPRPAVLTTRGRTVPAELPADLAGALRALSRASGATLFMTLLAGFAVLLGRYARTEDLLIGTPVANRQRPEIEPLVGLFANILALRVRLAAAPSFRELVVRVREATLGVFDHQELPFEKLVDELGLAREPSQTPLFQVVFALQNMPAPERQLPGLRLQPIGVHTGTAKFELTLSLAEDGARLAGSLEHRSDLFERDTALRMLGHLRTLLAEAAATPDRPITELQLLDDAERRHLLGAGNDWQEFPVTLPLHLSFEIRAAGSPDAVAASCAGHCLSRGELDARANRLAHALRRAGVTPETVVGLCAGRSLDLLIGMLGILKAGGAYLPLEPDSPPRRLAELLALAGARVLVSGERAAGRAPAPDGLVELRCDDPALAAEPSTPPVASSLAGHLAYVLFTSGSTGSPKGVAVAHAQVARLLDASRRMVGFGGGFGGGGSDAAGDVWTLFHSFAFDFSVWEIWGALLYGTRLVIVPFEVSRSPELFHELLAREQVSILNQTPSAFLLLSHARQGSAGRLPALRRIVFGGEALDPESLRPWIHDYGDVRPRLINMYGITETTVHVTWHAVSADEAERGVGRIGRPLPDLQVHLLDSHLQLVPVGVPGEICVAGAGLARGYAGAPHLTAERFLPNPLCREPGDRLYRSGDLARRHSDGSLQYLGRLDAQLKVRGFRIEPAEIEAVLRRHPAVRETAVAGRGAAGEQRLVAYCATGSDPAPAPEELRAWLQQALPAYMIPAAFVFLAALPQTPNGKIDRRALPDPGQRRPDLETEYAPPRTPSEEVLAQVWAQVLEIERVGVHDNFFVLGGDSISSLRVRAIAEQRGLSFTLPQLFVHQTVAELARQIQDGAGAGRGETAAPVAPLSLISAADRAALPADVVDAYPLTAVQAGMLYHMAYQPAAIVYHNVYSYHLRAPFDAALFRQAAAMVVAAHPILRTSFDLAASSEPLQRVHRTAELLVEVNDWRPLPPAEQERLLDDLIEREKHRGFDLSRPPLVRFGLHRRSDETFNFSLTECHPIFDGWSLHSFLSEVFEVYLALLDGRAPAAGTLRLSIADFVALERAALESPACREYWEQVLTDCKPLPLPGWLPDELRVVRGEGGGMRLATLQLPEPLSDGLKSLARETAVPLKSVLLTAHLEVMAAWSGERDVVTGLLCNGRPEGLDGDRVLGLFFNSVPFRMHLPAGSWGARVQAVFAAERALLPHRRYPLARLQQSRGGKPLFEVLFNYIHFHMLRRLFASGRIELLGGGWRWEETTLPLGVVFMQNPLTGALNLMLRHDTGRVLPATAQRLLASYQRVLQAMAERAAGPFGWLSEAERHQVLREWNDTRRRPSPPLFLDSFSSQARRTPDAPALVSEATVVSYRGLDAAANRLARSLRRLGVGLEDRVGLYLRRSPDLFIAMLGTLKAGAAYVPLDPLNPSARIAQIVAEARLAALLTEDALVAQLSLPDAAPDLPVLRLDGQRHLPAAAGADDAKGADDAEDPGEPPAPVPPEAAAYVLFTSGSTGAPKGVVVEHRQLANYLGGILERLPLPPGSSFTLVSTIAADLGNTVIFPSLATGGCLHVVAEERCADAAALEDALTRRPGDVLKIVPSHLAALLGSAHLPARLLPRRCLVLGGEALERSLVRAVRSLGGGCALFNHYGPTETTVGVAAWPVDDAESGDRVALGRPLAGTQILVLDRELSPVLAGAPGELFIAGAALARGYLERPELTAECFLPHPDPGSPGERIYRTGDQARHLPDGRLEFLGRRDGQVKIRGFRIELREVEAALGRHPAVRECAVTLHQGRGGDRRLAAFCTANGGAPPDDSELRGFLRRSLPSYMLPAAFVWLDALPRNANGKLDRQALPATGDLFASWRARYVAPRSELERAIAAVWRDVLQVPRIGMDDNFFDLGGHSLVALRIHSLLKKQLQRDLSMVTLFEHPTISSLAEHLSREQAPDALADEAARRAAARHAAFEQRRALEHEENA
jgi:amino acid adenylation domain-containing protein